MTATKAERPRPTRPWSPTRALLWERWRMTWYLVVLPLLALPVMWVNWVIDEGAEDPESFVLMLGAFVFTGPIIFPVFLNSRLPKYRFHLPVTNAHLAFADHIYAVAWLFLCCLWVVLAAKLMDVPDTTLIIVPQVAVAMMAIHAFVRVYVSHCYFLALPFLGGVLVVFFACAGWIPLGEWLWDPVDAERANAVAWSLGAVFSLVAGFFVSWVTIARERSYAFAKPLEIRLPSFRTQRIRQEPFTSPFRAQVWLEFHCHRPLFFGSLVVLALLAGGFCIGFNPLRSGSSHFAEYLWLLDPVRWLLLFILPPFAALIGCHQRFEEGHCQKHFFTRPVGTYSLALTRLMALARVGCTLLTVAGAVEAAYHLARHSAEKEMAAQNAQIHSRAASSFTQESDDSAGAINHRVHGTTSPQGRSWPSPPWGWMAAGYVILIWCCLASPVMSTLFFVVGGYIREYTQGDSPYSLYLSAFVILVLVLHGVSARGCFREGLVGGRTVIFAGLAIAGLSTVFFVGTAGVDSHAEFSFVLVTLLLLSTLPFTYVPWRLHRQRHQ